VAQGRRSRPGASPDCFGRGARAAAARCELSRLADDRTRGRLRRGAHAGPVLTQRAPRTAAAFVNDPAALALAQEESPAAATPSSRPRERAFLYLPWMQAMRRRSTRSAAAVRIAGPEHNLEFDRSTRRSSTASVAIAPHAVLAAPRRRRRLASCAAGARASDYSTRGSVSASTRPRRRMARQDDPGGCAAPQRARGSVPER